MSMASRLSTGLVLCFALAGCASDISPAAEPTQAAPAVSAAPPASDAVAVAVEPQRVVDGFVSSFLVPLGQGAVLLVDCGFDPEGKALLAALRDRGLEPDAVKAILLTHAHADHLGGCHLFPKAEIHAFAPREELVAGSEKPLTAAIHPLQDGGTVTIQGLTIRTYAVPGHTADGAAFLAGNMLFLGDAGTAAADGKQVKAAPWIFTGADKRPDETKQNVAALARLHQRLVSDKAQVQKLWFAHSDPTTDFDALTRAQ